jgi:alpha-D-ribose 1-methylphosphonate 5-triphosphate diphosphatase PhnM
VNAPQRNYGARSNEPDMLRVRECAGVPVVLSAWRAGHRVV